MMTKTFRTILVKDGNAYHGYVPALPGCHTDGKTIEETQKNLTEAIEGWIMARQELGWSVPDDTLIETLQTVRLAKPSFPPAYA